MARAKASIGTVNYTTAIATGHHKLTADEGPDVAIPGRAYGFATLIAAQAWGDFEVLERRGRRVVRIHLGTQPERGLDDIVEALHAARV